MATRYEHKGAAVPTTLAADYDPADPTITIASATGWPTGAVGPFVVCIAAGTADEHKLLIESRSGTTLTVSDSTFDDTADVAHSSGAAIIHCLSAKELDEANDLASDLTALGGTPVTTSAAQTLTGKSIDLTDNTVTGTKAEFNAAMTDADFATLTGTETLTNKTLTAPAATGSLTGFGGAWSTWTPTVGGLSIGNGTASYRYQQVGKTVRFVICVTMGSTSSVSAAMTFTPPVPPGYPFSLDGRAYDASTDSLYMSGSAYNSVPSNFSIRHEASASSWSASLPFTWASGDQLIISGTYEVA